MDDPRYIRHVTLNTGHRRDSRRDEIGPPALDLGCEIIDRLVAAGRTPLPHPAGYAIIAVAGAYTRAEEAFWRMVGRAAPELPLPPGRCLTAVIYRDAGKLPLAIVSVAGHRRCGANTWSNLWAHGEAIGIPIRAGRPQPAPPWCAALLLPGIVSDPSAADWLGDFELVLAWAWILRLAASSTAGMDELEAHALRPGGPARPV